MENKYIPQGYAAFINRFDAVFVKSVRRRFIEFIKENYPEFDSKVTYIAAMTNNTAIASKHIFEKDTQYEYFVIGCNEGDN